MCAIVCCVRRNQALKASTTLRRTTAFWRCYEPIHPFESRGLSKVPAISWSCRSKRQVGSFIFSHNNIFNQCVTVVERMCHEHWYSSWFHSFHFKNVVGLDRSWSNKFHRISLNWGTGVNWFLESWTVCEVLLALERLSWMLFGVLVSQLLFQTLSWAWKMLIEEIV